MIYIPILINIGSGIQKSIEGESQTHRQNGDRISLLYESKLKIDITDKYVLRVYTGFNFSNCPVPCFCEYDGENSDSVKVYKFLKN
jgi:hypothetical protein